MEGNAAKNGFSNEVKEIRTVQLKYPSAVHCLTLIVGLVCDLVRELSNDETSGIFLMPHTLGMGVADFWNAQDQHF